MSSELEKLRSEVARLTRDKNELAESHQRLAQENDLLRARVSRIENYIDVQVQHRYDELQKNKAEDVPEDKMVVTQDIMAWVNEGLEIQEMARPEKHVSESVTNFDRIGHYNAMIGNEPMTIVREGEEVPEGAANPVSMEEFWKNLRHQFDLIASEVDEMDQAINEEDLEKLRDGGADSLVTIYGLLFRANIHADEDLRAIHRSNMTKFCQTQEEAEETQESYNDIDVESEIKEKDGFFYLISTADQYGTDGKFYPEGKHLKGINFQEPELG